MNNKNDTEKEIGNILGHVAVLFIDSFFLMVAWNAIAAVAGLPTFNYWIYFAVWWVFKKILGRVSKDERT